jgi:hypothetical protein
MAGSASNWYKTPGSAKGSVYLSRAHVALYFDIPNTNDITPKEGGDLLRSDPAMLADAIDLIRPKPPKGSAKFGGAINSLDGKAKQPPAAPAGWAEDELSKMIAMQQQIPYGMNSGKNPAALAFDEAFRAQNPSVRSFFATTDNVLDLVNTIKSDPDYYALWEYTAGGYKAINNLLWQSSRGDGGEIQRRELVSSETRWATDIQATITKTTSPADFVATRAMKKDHPLAAWAQSVEVGAGYTSLGFDSSSLRPNIDVNGSDVLLKMRVPKGSRGMNINSVFPDGLISEQEWLIPANSSWVVTGKSVDANGKMIVEVDLVDQRNFDGSLIWP